MLTRVFSAIKKVFSKQQVSERAEIAEDILYGKASSADLDAVRAVAELTAALCSNQCAGVVDAGVFVFFKIKTDKGDFQIFHKRLTVRERAAINKKPSILSEPYRLLERLDDVVALEHDRATELRQIAMMEEKKR